jgi:predicted dehydrogenase
VAGCDVDPDRLRAFGDDWGLSPRALFTDYREMLDRIRPDIVSVCAYAPDRSAMIDAAVERGARGLWIEKAIACSIGEADAIAAAVAREGVAVVVDQPRRGESSYLGVKDLIDRRAWGALQSVHCLMSGHLMHTGIHAWDVLRLWCGDWTAAAAWLTDEASPDAASRARMGDSSGRLSAILAASDGVHDRGGHAHVIFDSAVHAFVSGGVKDYFVFQFELQFEGGRLKLGNDVDETWTPAPSPRYSGFRELARSGAVPSARAPRPVLADLLDAMESTREPCMSLSHACGAFRLGVALFQSQLESHRFVTPDTLRRDLRVVSI